MEIATFLFMAWAYFLVGLYTRTSRDRRPHRVTDDNDDDRHALADVRGPYLIAQAGNRKALPAAIRPVEGITLGDQTEVEGFCPICGDILSGVTVRCDSCRTRHHDDCWRYNGLRCAVYGCAPEAEVALLEDEAEGR